MGIEGTKSVKKHQRMKLSLAAFYHNKTKKTPLFTTCRMVTFWFYYDRTLLKIVSSFDVSSHFWFLLCPHNLRPLLRSRPLTWAWSLLSTCSVINLMNKHTARQK